MIAEIEETVKLTPTEKRFLQLLSDGKPHHESELITCLHDELGNKATVRVHITSLRKKIIDKRLGIIAHRPNRRLHYQLVGLLYS